MFDAITNFIAYLEESIENSSDAEEIQRYEYVLDKARRIRDQVANTMASASIPS